MDARSHAFLKELLQTPSPSGYEQAIQEVVRKYVKSFADRVSTDVHGNVFAVVNPDAELRVMLAGHCDQVGFVVQYVDEKGYIYVQPIGGADAQEMLSHHVRVLSKDGPRPGVLARKSHTLLESSEKSRPPQLHEVWVDIGAASKEEALSLVRIGDPVAVELQVHELSNKRIAAAGLDDKIGLWACVEAMRRAKERGKLRVGLHVVSTVQEEVGLRGAQTSAFAINPHVAIACDVCHSTDCSTISKKQKGDVRVGSGPVVYRGASMNPRVAQRLVEAAESKKIPLQHDAAGKAAGTDASAMQIARDGVATGQVSIPCRYMHSPVEIVSLEDADHAAELLATFTANLSANVDFTP